jgi:3-deoxy-manno-octulosonate cytidylyltransferase (CMP-KDO synthetase)
MTVALIPARLKSSRLHNKPLIKIAGLPMVVRVLRNTLKSKKFKKVIVCADDNRIIKVLKKYNHTGVLTSKKHRNGTERIAEVAKKNNSKIIIDVQCDSVFVNHKNLEKLVNFHKKNMHFDIVIPHINFEKPNDKSAVKLVVNKKNEIIYMSREDIPFSNNKKKILMKKHLDYISFKRDALLKFINFKQTPLEVYEGIELLRAIENNLKVGTFKIKNDLFSVNTKKDLYNAIKILKAAK